MLTAKQDIVIPTNRRHISCSTCQLYTGRMLLQCQPTMSKHWKVKASSLEVAKDTDRPQASGLQSSICDKGAPQILNFRVTSAVILRLNQFAVTYKVTDYCKAREFLKLQWFHNPQIFDVGIKTSIRKTNSSYNSVRHSSSTKIDWI